MKEYVGEDKKLATRLRLDFVPVDLGPQGIQDLHIVLITLMPGGWEYFLKHGKITRLDVAVDFPGLAMDDFHFLPTKGATSTVFRQHFAAQVQPWWDFEKLWSEWSKSLDDLTLLSPEAWG